MKYKMKLNAENWIDGEVDVTVYEVAGKVTIKSKGRATVMVRWGTVGPRARGNAPRWLVYVDGNLNPDIRIYSNQHDQCSCADYMDTYRAVYWSRDTNIGMAAAIVAWQIVMSTY